MKENTMGGIFGRILHVDLTTGQTEVETLPRETYLKLLGGRALSAYYLLRELAPGVDPLGPENILVFAPGILQGTGLPGTGRHGIGGKSPLTGAVGSSESGGWWGHEFKRTGFDALVVKGRSPQPAYLWIKDGQAEIRPAGHLWGRKTAETERLIRQELGDDKVRVAQIGPGGENLVRYAAVMHDINRAAGRNGLGAVMGSKNLKAVAVRGGAGPEIADRQRLAKVAKWLGENYAEKAAWAVKFGTVIGVTSLNGQGALPTRAFRDASFEGGDKIGWQSLKDSILIGRDTCAVCPIKCKQVVEYEDPQGRRSIDPAYGGPEYETLAALGSNCGVDDLVAVSKASELCNAYGLDTISTGMVIAFVMECVEKGLLSAEETGGYLPWWGDAEALLEGIELIAAGQGFGQRMAQGSARLAAEIGPQAQALALTIKGQELPMHEPRFKAAMGLGYAVAPVGADHMMNIHDADYSFESGKLARLNSVFKTGPQKPGVLDEDKLSLFFHETNWAHFLDCALVCMFHPYSYEHVAEALSAVTGVEFSIHDLLAVGQRAQTLCRLFNQREGFTAADDVLPQRVMTPFEEGPLAGQAVGPEKLAWARSRYYEMMGWEPETGRPLERNLDDLGL